MSDDELQATPYEIYMWDCPVCGEVNEEGDVEPAGMRQCGACAETVEVRR